MDKLALLQYFYDILLSMHQPDCSCTYCVLFRWGIEALKENEVLKERLKIYEQPNTTKLKDKEGK